MAPPVIVLGVGRSGTTLLRVMLDGSSRLAVPDESYFIPQLATHERVIAISPQTSTQTSYTLSDRGAEAVTVARQSLPAHHFAMVSPSGSTRDVWVDAAGRLLRVAFPETQLVAVRDELPR